MQANQTTLQQIIEGSKQYIVPLFQRVYSWTKSEWETLWDDIEELCSSNVSHTHFLGSLVTMPELALRQGSVTKFLLIDGQQRLTTLFLVLAALRDFLKEQDSSSNLSQAISQNLLINSFEVGDNYYKLLPTQVDRESFFKILSPESILSLKTTQIDQNSGIQDCYKFFYKKINESGFPGKELRDVICSRLSLVRIDLEGNDDPYLVFESLNAKGKPLTQSDLIRNFIFMKVSQDEQAKIHAALWQPMENLLQDDLTEFIRHYLSRKGDDIRKGHVYAELKKRVQDSDPYQALQDLADFSIYYSKLLNPSREEHPKVRYALSRVHRLEVTILYPFLLNCYNDFASNKLDEFEFVEVLKTIENFVLRRFICDVPTRGLNRVFVRLHAVTQKQKELTGSRFVDCLQAALQTQGYPTDLEFVAGLKTTPLYGGTRSEKCRLILEAIEGAYGHKEKVVLEDLSIEHIMPQKLTEEWKEMLGEDAEADHDLLKHTLGNLTLTGYNSEMSNVSFEKKREHYLTSRLELNKYFEDLKIWNRQQIEARAVLLCNQALEIWQYFGNPFLAKRQTSSFTGSKPVGLIIRGQEYRVKTWRDVLEYTLNAIYHHNPEKFKILQEDSSLITKDSSRLRSFRQLDSGHFVEVNLSAQNIYEYCIKALSIAAISQDEWILKIE